MNPTVSIIVPIYNCEDTIARCLDSILVQTFDDFELILVDDGSTDCSGRICEDFARRDSRIRVLHKKNGGVSAARNSGLEIATGKYVCFADADDYVSERWVEIFIDAVTKYPNSLIVENVYIEEPSKQYECYPIESGIQSLSFFWAGAGWGYSWNKIYRKGILDVNGIRFDDSIAVREDEQFIANYCRYVDGVYICEEIGYYYINVVDFGVKYSGKQDIYNAIYQYERVRVVNEECSHFIVDRLVMGSFSAMKAGEITVKDAALEIKKTVGSDIKYVLGKKKILMRFLSHTMSDIVWQTVFLFYSVMGIL